MGCPCSQRNTSPRQQTGQQPEPRQSTETRRPKVDRGNTWTGPAKQPKPATDAD